MRTTSSHRWPGRTAFTLIELLVVIAVLGILAALVFSTLRSAAPAAQRSGCSSNLHQIFVGMMAYAADNGNHLPYSYAARDYSFAYPLNVTWDKVLAEEKYLPVPGLIGPNIFKCPADNTGISPRPDVIYPLRTYYINENVFSAFNADGSLNVTYCPDPNSALSMMSRVRKPLSQVVIMADRAAGNEYSRYGPLGGVNPGGYGTGTSSGVDPNVTHTTGCNYLFLDGHVQFMNYMQGSTGARDGPSAAFGSKYYLTY